MLRLSSSKVMVLVKSAYLCWFSNSIDALRTWMKKEIPNQRYKYAEIWAVSTHIHLLQQVVKLQTFL